MTDEFFASDLSKLEIERLILRILRFKPKWLYSICRDPTRLEKKKAFKESSSVYNYFKDAGVVDFIIDNFRKIPIGNFISQLLERCHLFFNTDDIISEEIKELNKSVREIDRLYKKLPSNFFSYKDNQNNSLYLKYDIQLINYYIVLQFYAILHIFCEEDHHNIFQINKNRLKRNLNRGFGYIVHCSTCNTEYVLPPNLSQLSENLGDGIFQVNGYTPLRATILKPQSFAEQIISKIEPDLIEKVEVEPLETNNAQESELSSIEYIGRELERKNRYSKRLLKESRLYRNEHIYFKEKNLNTRKFRNIIKEIIEGEYDGFKFSKQISMFKDIKGIAISSSSDEFTDFLFKLTRIAGKFKKFDQYCILLNYFSSWDLIYAKQFSDTANRMFKNMILKIGRSGINYPINASQDLIEKVNLFNNISAIENINSETIVKATIDAAIDSVISNSSRNKIINLIKDLYEGNEELRDYYLMIHNYYIEKKLPNYADEFYRKATDLDS